MSEDHQKFINIIIKKHFSMSPIFIERMTTGSCNEVYKAKLSEREVIVRLSNSDNFLMGSHKHIPIFKELGIKVPDILAEDYSKALIPICYQIQSKIEGRDLGEVIQNLSSDELKAIAGEIAGIFKKVKTIPADGEFGYIYGHKGNLFPTWTEYIKKAIDQAMKRAQKTGVMEDWLSEMAYKLFDDYRDYFGKVKSENYFDDICSKNVMVDKGEFTGLVDLDCLAEGDYLDAVGRIKASWHGQTYGEIYFHAVMEAIGLSDEQKQIVTMYALLNRIVWTCENGIQFNQNTKSVVDGEKDRINKEVVKNLAVELYENCN